MLLSNLGTQIQNSPSFGTNSPFTVSAGAHGGFWLYLLGMAAYQVYYVAFELWALRTLPPA